MVERSTLGLILLSSFILALSFRDLLVISAHEEDTSTTPTVLTTDKSFEQPDDTDPFDEEEVNHY